MLLTDDTEVPYPRVYVFGPYTAAQIDWNDPVAVEREGRLVLWKDGPAFYWWLSLPPRHCPQLHTGGRRADYSYRRSAWHAVHYPLDPELYARLLDCLPEFDLLGTP